jgi:eukaryotic-like serine/threonine-protein kinase
MQLQVGDTVAGFQVEAILGHGNMGSVYRARGADARAVALKVIGPQSPLDRFQAEAETLSQLSHAGIPRVYGYAMQPVAYLAEEIMEGPTLEEVLAGGPLPWHGALQLAHSLLGVLQVIHEHGFVHRDLNPSNLILRGDQVCVVDFGLVRKTDPDLRRTLSGEIVGTLHYLAPEQVDSARGPISPRTDIFAAGVLVYGMLTGSTPTHSGASAPRVLRQTLDEPPPAMDGIDAGLQSAVFKALEKEPSARYASAGEFAQALVDRGGR